MKGRSGTTGKMQSPARSKRMSRHPEIPKSKIKRKAKSKRKTKGTKRSDAKKEGSPERSQRIQLEQKKQQETRGIDWNQDLTKIQAEDGPSSRSERKLDDDIEMDGMSSYSALVVPGAKHVEDWSDSDDDDSSLSDNGNRKAVDQWHSKGADQYSLPSIAEAVADHQRNGSHLYSNGPAYQHHSPSEGGLSSPKHQAGTTGSESPGIAIMTESPASLGEDNLSKML